MEVPIRIHVRAQEPDLQRWDTVD